MQASSSREASGIPAEHDLYVAEALARETDTPLQLVQKVYGEELSKLAEQATITQFLGVIATRRARLRLRHH